MKLEDIKAPKGFEIRGYEMPEPGDYILCSNNVARRICVDDFEYHCAVIVLDPAWEPEIGKYYEFSDYSDFSDPEIHKLKEFNDSYIETNTLGFKYIDDKGTQWRYIRSIEGDFGK